MLIWSVSLEIVLFRRLSLHESASKNKADCRKDTHDNLPYFLNFFTKISLLPVWK